MAGACTSPLSPSSDAEMKNGAALPPLLTHMFSWCGAYIKPRDNLTYLTF